MTVRLLPPPFEGGRYVCKATGRPVRGGTVHVALAPGEPAHLELVSVDEAGGLRPVRPMWPSECGCGVCEECKARTG